jgi:hypothetical protein
VTALGRFHLDNERAVGSIPAALGFFLGPIVSVMSDNHRSRWGRRIPFLLIPTPIATLSVCGLAFSPKLGTWLHEWLGAFHAHLPQGEGGRVSSAANTLAMLAFGPVNTFRIFYAKSVGMDVDRYGKCLALSWRSNIFFCQFG